MDQPQRHYGVITLFPAMFDALNAGMPQQARQKSLYRLTHINPRHYADHARGYVDDRPYGGGPGMVMCAPPISRSIAAAKRAMGTNTPVIYFSPHGQPLTQSAVADLAQQKALILLCGRYEGIDQRLIDAEVDVSYCVADCIFSGGEIPAMACIDAMIRLIPGTLNNPMSAAQDSFSNNLLDHPHYTRPLFFKNIGVPPVLLSGNHVRIRDWCLKQALVMTQKYRPELLHNRADTPKESFVPRQTKKAGKTEE